MPFNSDAGAQQLQQFGPGQAAQPTLMNAQQLASLEAQQRMLVNQQQQQLAQQQQVQLYGQRQYQGQPGQQFNPAQAAQIQVMDPRTQGYQPLSVPPQYAQQAIETYFDPRTGAYVTSLPQQQQYVQPGAIVTQGAAQPQQLAPQQAPAVDPTVGMDLSGLDHLIGRATSLQYGQQVVADLQQQFHAGIAAAQQAAVAQVQAQAQAQIQQLENEVAGLREALTDSMLQGRSPQEQQYIRVRMAEAQQRDENARLQRQLEEQQTTQQKTQALNYLSEKYGVHPAQLAGTNTFAEAELRAIKITQAQQQRQAMQVPAAQFNVGPSGGVGQAFRIPHPDSPQFDDFNDQLAGRTPRSTFQRRSFGR